MEKQQKIAAAITRAATNVIFVKAFSQLIHHGEQRRHTRHTHASHFGGTVWEISEDAGKNSW